VASAPVRLFLLLLVGALLALLLLLLLLLVGGDCGWADRAERRDLDVGGPGIIKRQS